MKLLNHLQNLLEKKYNIKDGTLKLVKDAYHHPEFYISLSTFVSGALASYTQSPMIAGSTSFVVGVMSVVKILMDYGFSDTLREGLLANGRWKDFLRYFMASFSTIPGYIAGSMLRYQ